jgi:predicted methyltransferase
LLEFIGVGRGERIADLGAGTGCCIALLAQAVGPAGAVYVRHDPRTLAALPSDPGPRPSPVGALPANVILMPTSMAEPFSAAARDLNVVTLLFAYRDWVDQKLDLQKLNAAVFRALQPGGNYVIAEHADRSGSIESGQEPSRSSEPRVREQIEAAGFLFVESAELLSNSSGPRGTPTTAVEGSQYVLKFQKPR